MDSHFVIKKATTSDIPLIIELAARVWPQTYTPILGQEQVTYMMELFYTPEALRKQMEEGHQFIVCYREKEPVAFASYAATGQNIFKLHKIYALPGMQGTGIGRYLMEYIVSELKQSGAGALQLNVNRYNENAIAFYSKIGFKQICEEDIDIGGGYFMNDYVLGLVI